MSLYNDASLILIPSGYKEDIIFSEKPTDGSGDLTLTRASNGTRVNSAGLVEVVPWNLLQYSEQIDNGVWIKFSPTSVTADTTTAPNGTTTADTISTSATSVIRQNTTLNANEIYTYSIYVKKISYDFFGFQNLVNGSGVKSVFDLSNGTVTTQGSGHTASIESIGNGWYRCSISFNTGSSASNIFDLASDGTSATLRTFYAWGAQSNIGSTAKPYFPTTDRLNVPRLTYQNGGGGCPSLLLEKQSTNLFNYSQDFSNAFWNKTNIGIGDVAVITPNYAISPDGTQNASRLVCNLNGGTTASTRSWMLANFTAQATSTISIWIKLNSAGTKTIIFSESGGHTKTISGTDWQRIDTSFVGANGEFRIGLIGGSTSDTLDCSIWGAQAESGSYPTSYIPTTSSSATRVADACFKTGIGSLFGTNKGTFFWQGITPYYISGMAQYLWDISDTINFNLNRFALYMVGTNSVQLYTSVTGGNNATLAQNSFAKIALVWNGTSCSLYINGALAISNQTISNSNPTAIHLNTRYSLNENGNTEVGKVVVFNTNLTNAELISLTTI